MYCGTCGKKVHRGDAFCEFCGGSLVARSRIAPVAFSHPQRGVFNRRTIAVLSVFAAVMVSLAGLSWLRGDKPGIAPPPIAAMTPTAALSPVPAAASDTAVVFADPIVEARIRARYITKQGPITVEDMASVRLFEYDSINDKYATGTILTLDDLRHCKNLQVLRVCGQPITSIEALRGLQRLTNVILTNCAVTDLSPLAGKQALQEVCISGNPVSDASMVLSLPTLRSFNAMWGTNITDISALGTKTGLLEFHCMNTLKDYSPLYRHTGMMTLSLSGISNDDCAAILAGMKELTTLRIEGSRIDGSSLSLLNGRTLYKLDINNCGLRDISALALLKGIRNLSLRQNNIIDISPLAGLTLSGHVLDLQYNNISDYSPLKNMRNLAVYVSGNPVTDDESLREMEKHGCFIDR